MIDNGQTHGTSPTAVSEALSGGNRGAAGRKRGLRRGAAASDRTKTVLDVKRARALSAGSRTAADYIRHAGGNRQAGFRARGVCGGGTAPAWVSDPARRASTGIVRHGIHGTRGHTGASGLSGIESSDRAGAARLRGSCFQLSLGESRLDPDPGSARIGENHGFAGSGAPVFGPFSISRGSGGRARRAGRLPGGRRAAERGTPDGRYICLPEIRRHRTVDPLHGAGLDRGG